MLVRLQVWAFIVALTEAWVSIVGVVGQRHGQRYRPLHTLHGQVGLRGLDVEERLVVVVVVLVLRA